MIARLTATALLCLAAAPAVAQPPIPPAAAPTAPAAPQFALVKVRLQTSEGPIVLALEKQRAPITTANFLRYVDQKKLDGVSFYRSVKVTPTIGFIQGGTRNDPKRTLPPIKHEPSSTTGVHNVDGTIAMARSAPGTASGDFFILVGDEPTMDADPKAPGDNQGFAAFGHVVEGMDVVRHIMDAATSATAGAGVMKGSMIADPIRIIAAKRVE
ncbi:MAG: peptidylprolyl isomerase [Janthinobacterium lividum]